MPGLEIEPAELGLVDCSIQVSSNWYSTSFGAEAFGNAQMKSAAVYSRIPGSCPEINSVDRLFLRMLAYLLTFLFWESRKLQK